MVEYIVPMKSSNVSSRTLSCSHDVYVFCSEISIQIYCKSDVHFNTYLYDNILYQMALFVLKNHQVFKTQNRKEMQSST